VLAYASGLARDPSSRLLSDGLAAAQKHLAESATDNEDNEVVIGIDLGTTYSCVGVWQNNTVVMVPNDRGQITTPSYVNFTETGKRSVGSAAKNLAARYPATTIYVRPTYTPPPLFHFSLPRSSSLCPDCARVPRVVTAVVAVCMCLFSPSQDVKRFIGQRFEDEGVSQDVSRMTYPVVASEPGKEAGTGKGQPLIKVDMGMHGLKTFAAEEVSAMVLGYLKKTAETFLKKVRNSHELLPEQIGVVAAAAAGGGVNFRREEDVEPTCNSFLFRLLPIVLPASLARLQGRHHRARLLQRLPARCHQGRWTHRWTRCAPHHQRAHRRCTVVRFGSPPQGQAC